jgi:uncharacterized membrane protein
MEWFGHLSIGISIAIWILTFGLVQFLHFDLSFLFFIFDFRLDFSLHSFHP